MALSIFWIIAYSLSAFSTGAALMKQVKTATNKGVQHYQHWLYATFWQDNPVAEGYLG